MFTSSDEDLVCDFEIVNGNIDKKVDQPFSHVENDSDCSKCTLPPTRKVNQPICETEETFQLSESSSSTPNDSEIEELTTSSVEQVITQKKWRIMKFPLHARDNKEIFSPVLTVVNGHQVQLICALNNNGDARVSIYAKRVDGATNNDLKQWENVSFFVGDKRIGRSISLKSTDIEKYLDGEDLVLKLTIKTSEFKVASSNIMYQRVMFFIIVCIYIAIAIRLTTTSRPVKNDLLTLKHAIINLNDELMKIVLDDNRNWLLTDVDDELKLLRKSMSKLNIGQEPTMDQGKPDNVFLKFAKNKICWLSDKYLPKADHNVLFGNRC